MGMTSKPRYALLSRIYVIFGWVIIAAEQPFLRLLQIALRLLRLARLNRVLGQIEGRIWWKPGAIEIADLC